MCLYRLIFALLFISAAHAADLPLPLEISAAQFSADGKKILFIDSRNYAHALDIAAGGITSYIQLRPTEEPRTAFFSADGKYFITFTEVAEEDDGLVTYRACVYDVEKAKFISDFPSDFKPRSRPAFSPDGKYLLIATDSDGTLLHDVATGKLLFQLRANRHRVCSASFSPDSKTVLTSGMGGTVQTWDAQTGKVLLNRRLGKRTEVFSAYLPDGKSFFTQSAGEYAYFDAATGEPIERPVPFTVSNSFIISPDASALLVSTFGDLTLFDMATAKEIAKLAGNIDSDNISFSADSKTLLITQDNTCTLYSAATLTPLANLHLLTDSNWAVTTIAGNYDASFQGNPDVLPCVLRAVPADTQLFKSLYYTPHLLSEHLK